MRRDDARRPPAPRAGFTLIELLIVFGIAAVLIGMSAFGVTRGMQRAALNRAVAAIEETATEARLLSLNTAGGSQAPAYGVVIGWDQFARRSWVGLARLTPGDGRASDADRVLDDRRRFLPPSAVVWIGDEEVGSSSDPTEIAWYYQPATGLPLARQGARLSANGVTVGVAPPRLTRRDGKPYFGVDDDMVVVQVAPPTATSPGLSVRSRDQRLRRAIAVYATGTFLTGEY